MSSSNSIMEDSKAAWHELIGAFSSSNLSCWNVNGTCLQEFLVCEGVSAINTIMSDDIKDDERRICCWTVTLCYWRG
ncbi:hypothetical protein GUJ93_ZPchr0006g44544 [Zizania palustris]|uniref:Uncharacterized protein n=1 Tax=Zizania palustris TaxID=103762 RepID=A0A8J5VIE4_ZIZPA|nr:hypothetical protein GUJ93_ZPchr0006g44544 [Zizania palustris]